MNVIPAIDLINGKCVRLTKGKKKDITVYSIEPLALANEYKSNGAKRIHVIDLDGAFSGEMKNIGIIKDLAKRFDIQVGGGVRSKERIDELLSFGVQKVIISTLLFRNKTIANEIKNKYFGKLIGALDFRKNQLSYAGWTKQSKITFEEVAQGLNEIMVTDAERDGTLSGPNLELIRSIRTQYNAKILTAGGVRNLMDVIELEKAGANGVIVGKAILETTIPQKEWFSY